MGPGALGARWRPVVSSLAQQTADTAGGNHIEAVGSNQIEAVTGLLVNGDASNIEPGSTLSDLLRELGLEGRRVAIAVNRTVIPKSRYDAVALSAGDHVEILEAVGGG